MKNEKWYEVNIYDFQHNLIDTIEVLAGSKIEAESIGFDEWLEGLRDNHYSIVENENDDEEEE